MLTGTWTLARKEISLLEGIVSRMCPILFCLRPTRHILDITFNLPMAALGLRMAVQSPLPCCALERPFQGRSLSQIPPEARTVTMHSNLWTYSSADGCWAKRHELHETDGCEAPIEQSSVAAQGLLLDRAAAVKLPCLKLSYLHCHLDLSIMIVQILKQQICCLGLKKMVFFGLLNFNLCQYLSLPPPQYFTDSRLNSLSFASCDFYLILFGKHLLWALLKCVVASSILDINMIYFMIITNSSKNIFTYKFSKIFSVLFFFLNQKHTLCKLVEKKDLKRRK